MEYNNNLDWLSYLEQTENRLNSTPSRPGSKLLGYSPNEIVSNADLEKKVRKQHALKTREKYLKLSKRKETFPPLHVGSVVRVLKPKDIYNKGYLPQFSQKTEFVQKIYPTPIKTFKITGSNQKFYRHQLALVREDTSAPLYKIYDTRSITQTRLRSGTSRQKDTEYLVGQLNASDSKKKWMTESQVKKLRKDGLLHDASI